MNKKVKAVIISGAAVAVLTGILLLLIFMPESCGGEASGNAASGDAHTHEHESGAITNESGEMLISRDTDEIARLVLKNENGTYTMHLDSSGKKLQIDELSDVPINADFAQFIWYGAVSVGWNSVLRDDDGTTPDNLEQFGLSPAKAVCTVYYTDGTSDTISLGNKTTSGDGIYYFTVSGFEGIYTTYFDSAFFQGDRYFLSDDIFSVSENENIEDIVIDNISISGSAFPEPAVISKVTTQDESDPLYGFDYKIKTTLELPCGDYQMSLLCDELSYLTANEALVFRPDAAALAQYGISNPTAVVSFTRNGVPCVLRCGTRTPELTYIMVDGLNVIYELKADSYPMLCTLSADILRSGELHVRQFTAVSSLSVSYGGKTCLISMTRSPIPTDKSLYEYHAVCGGKEVSTDVFRNVLSAFNSATIAGMDAQMQSTEPYITVKISYYPEFGRADETFCYYPAQLRRYLCTQNGVPMAAVTSMWTQKLIDAAEAAMNQ